MSGPLTPIAEAFFAALRPLRNAIAEPADLSVLLRTLGWQTTVTAEIVAAMPWTGQVTGLVADGEALLDDLDGAGALEATVRLLDITRQLVELIEGIQAAPPISASLPELFRDPAFWAELALDLPEYLFLRYLEANQRLLYGALCFFGIVTETSVPAAGNRAAFVRRRLVWASLADVLADPGGHLATRYGWGDGIRHDELVRAVQRFFRGLGFRARSRPVSAEFIGPGKPYASSEQADGVSELAIPLLGGVLAGRGYVEAGLLLVPVPDGVLLTNLAWGQAEAVVVLDPTWTLAVTGDAAATGDVGILSTPAGTERYGSSSAAGAGINLTGVPAQPWRLFGGDSGPRLELSAATAGVAFHTSDEPELVVEVTTADGGQPSLVLRVDAGDGDSFLSELLGALELSAPLDLSVRASSGGGITFGGSVGFEFTVPLDLAIGPVRLTELAIGLGAALDDGVTVAALSAAVDVAATLGPFTVAVEGIGAVAEVTHPATDSALARLGELGLDVRFKPPTALGFSVVAPLTSGGGRVAVYPEIGRYEGALAIDIAAVGIQAMTIIDAALPGEAGPWTFFASLTARFPGIPLGFGFVLTGVGGLVALNRTVDGEALALGLRDGAADALLFPDDPAGHSAVLFGQLDEYFPPAAGNTVIGPVIEVGWGTPTLITAQLGVLISVPQGVITILGSLSASLPVPNAPVLELQMDALGVVDVPGGTILVIASLYDSRLLGVIDLSGDVGMYVSIIEDPYFVLSVGGYHPGFQPPAHVPAVLEELRRMRADIDVGEGISAAITAYFAVTSNTVQFGGGFELEASAEFLTVTYTALGWFEFDVLLQFSPFALIADVSAGVGVYAGSKELLGVDLSAHLEGPDPWFATASGRFRFFVVTVRFDVAVGAHAAPAVPDTVDVLALMAAELACPEAWSARHPATAPAGLVLRPDIADALLRPDDSVVAVQSVAPLGQTLDRLGELTPVQTEVHVAATTVVDGVTGDALPDLAVEDVLGWFAPAQFRSMRDETRLSSPSYEQHLAGVCFGGGGVAVPGDDAVDAPAGYETDVWEPETGLVKSLGVVRTVATRDVILATSTTARAVTAWRGPKVAVEAVTVAPTGYVTVDATTGAADVDDGAPTRIVPAHALAVSVP
jgi:hypothetical protein